MLVYFQKTLQTSAMEFHEQTTRWWLSTDTVIVFIHGCIKRANFSTNGRKLHIFMDHMRQLLLGAMNSYKRKFCLTYTVSSMMNKWVVFQSLGSDGWYMQTLDLNAMNDLNACYQFSHVYFFFISFTLSLLHYSRQFWPRSMKFLWSEGITFFKLMAIIKNEWIETRFYMHQLEQLVLYTLVLNRIWLIGQSVQIQELWCMTRIVPFYNCNSIASKPVKYWRLRTI